MKTDDIHELIFYMIRGICAELLMKRLITSAEAEELERGFCNG